MRKKILASIGAAALIAGGGTLLGATVASAAGGDDHQATEAGYHVCVNPDSTIKRNAIYPNDAAHPLVCHGGSHLYSWLSKQDVNGHFRTDEAAINAVERQIAALHPAATATTVVSGWPETSGWADDTFNRTLSIARQSAVDAAKCGPTAKACWFYTGTISDNGSFTTNDGAKTPNASDGDATISGTVTGTMVGGTAVEFYASAAMPDASLVPATQPGKGTVGTSDWAKQMFPEDTVFGTFSLPTYSWTYTAPATCEQWIDQINPGDDGASADDGNISGVNACTQ